MTTYIKNFEADIFTFFITIEPKDNKVDASRDGLKMLCNNT